MTKELNKRQWKLVEWVQLAFKDKIITDERNRRSNLEITNAFLDDLNIIGKYANKNETP